MNNCLSLAKQEDVQQMHCTHVLRMPMLIATMRYNHDNCNNWTPKYNIKAVDVEQISGQVIKRHLPVQYYLASRPTFTRMLLPDVLLVLTY
jgi:hypothetical protein